MKKHLPTIPLLLLSINLWAQVVGPQSGRIFNTAPLPDADKSWVNIVNAGATDRQYASFGDLRDQVGSHTDYLLVTGFGFNLHPTAQIKGITLYVECSDPNATTSDYSIRIIKRGAITGTEHSTGTMYLGLGDRDTYRTYGNNSDLWGESWTAADIMGDDFGIAIAAQRAVTGRTTSGRIDNIRIQVTYASFSTLPVRLINFGATLKDEKVRLTWTTAEESDMDRFEVQRSANGSDFTSFGTIFCTNQRTTTNYSFNDYSPLQGVSYYRLKMLEKNGATTYSKTVSVGNNAEHTALLYPSPWKKGTALNIRNDGNQKLKIQFYNHAGQLLTAVSTSSTDVPVDALPKLDGILRYKVLDEKNVVRGSGTLMVW